MGTGHSGHDHHDDHGHSHGGSFADLADEAAADLIDSKVLWRLLHPVRAWIMSKNKLLGDLFKCFFCLSHWLAFAGVAIYQPRPLQATLLADLVVAAFTIVTISTLASGLMFATFFTAGQFHALRERMMQQQQGKAAVTSSTPAPAGVRAPAN